MPIYSQSGDKLVAIKEKNVDLEKTIQTTVEKNLNEIFGLTFVRTEYALNNLRIDTLAFDEEQKSFVIIEYKKDRSISVIDQGYAYLALLLNNKADFVLEYNEKCKKDLRKEDIDWSQSKILFIASAFTTYQKEAIGFQDLPIELWEVKLYENNLLSFNEIRSSERSESIKTISSGSDTEVVAREIRSYTVEEHFKPQWNKVKDLYEKLSQQILDLDPRIELHPVKNYIGFNMDGKNITLIKVRQSKLVIELLRTQPKDLNDIEKRVKYMEYSFKQYNQHVSTFDVGIEEDIDYAIMLIKQVYKRFIDF